MQETKQALAEALRTSRARLIELASNVSTTPSPVATSPSDNAQMVDGLTTVIVETLEGRDGARQLFVETLIPGLIESGLDPAGIIDGAVRFGVLSTFEVTSRLPREHATEAAIWMADFYAWLVTSICDIARGQVAS